MCIRDSSRPCIARYWRFASLRADGISSGSRFSVRETCSPDGHRRTRGCAAAGSSNLGHPQRYDLRLDPASAGYSGPFHPAGRRLLYRTIRGDRHSRSPQRSRLRNGYSQEVQELRGRVLISHGLRGEGDQHSNSRRSLHRRETISGSLDSDRARLVARLPRVGIKCRMGKLVHSLVMHREE